MEYVISWWSFLWLVDDQGIGSQHHQPSVSEGTGIYIPVGNIQLTSSTNGDFNIFKKPPKIWLRNYVCPLRSNWRSLALFIGSKIIIFSCLTVFLSAFSQVSDAMYSLELGKGLEDVSTDKRHVEDMVGGCLLWGDLFGSCPVVFMQFIIYICRAKLCLHF